MENFPDVGPQTGQGELVHEVQRVVSHHQDRAEDADRRGAPPELHEERKDEHRDPERPERREDRDRPEVEEPDEPQDEDFQDDQEEAACGEESREALRGLPTREGKERARSREEAEARGAEVRDPAREKKSRIVRDMSTGSNGTLET